MRLYNKVDKEVLKQKIQDDPRARITLSFYQYAHIGNPTLFRDHLFILLDNLEVLGRIYIAKEGVNAQISVLEANWNDFISALNSIVFLDGVRLNKAIEDDGKSFWKLKIKVREKIVADGLDDESFDVTDKGKHLSAKEFNELTDEPGTVIVDMRNHYESEVDMLEGKQGHNIVMYCTGGIRCEKASAYFKHKGFQKVHQLEGGIIEYARQAKELGIENKFVGKNFVFDDRLGEKISPDIISKCHQCGRPSDDHTNCANDACHILFIQCSECGTMYEGTCSTKCKDFNKLPEEEQAELKITTQFNGTKFGKGRYKAHRKDHSLE